MNTKQKKLLQQLAQLGDVTYINKTREGLIKAISEMDSGALALILDDQVSYQETTKAIFLSRLNEIFKQFRETDTNLIAYEGKCTSTECSINKVAGVSFVGNNSGNYLNLIIEQNENGSIKDIYNCLDFCTNENAINEYDIQLRLTVYNDEKVDFKPTKHYTFLNNNSINAINELKRFNNKKISKEQIINWIEENKLLNNSIDWSGMSYKNIDYFHSCYYDIDALSKFIIIEEESLLALQEFKTINTDEELMLLKWLIKFEHLNYEFRILHLFLLPEESIKTGRVILHNDFIVFLDTGAFNSFIDLQKIIDKHYREKLNKYNTLTKGVQVNELPFDNDYENNSSLKYHLEKRGII